MCPPRVHARSSPARTAAHVMRSVRVRVGPRTAVRAANPFHGWSTQQTRRSMSRRTRRRPCWSTSGRPGVDRAGSCRRSSRSWPATGRVDSRSSRSMSTRTRGCSSDSAVQHPDDDRDEGRSRDRPDRRRRTQTGAGGEDPSSRRPLVLSSIAMRAQGPRETRAPRAVVSIPGHCAAIGVPPRCGGLRL